jgi:hypothetical protein
MGLQCLETKQKPRWLLEMQNVPPTYLLRLEKPITLSASRYGTECEIFYALLGCSQGQSGYCIRRARLALCRLFFTISEKAHFPNKFASPDTPFAEQDLHNLSIDQMRMLIF